MKAKKVLIIIAAVTLSFVFLLPVLPIRGEEAVYEKVIRLHVLANSDSDEDQKIKLLVRDGVLEYVGSLTKDCSNVDEAKEALEMHLDEIKEVSDRILEANGVKDRSTVELGKESYPEREYEGVRLPSGEYCSLRISIGSAEGHNWWCVLFPPLCLSASRPDEVLVQAGFTLDQVKVLTETENPKYVLRFRILEFFKELLG